MFAGFLYMGTERIAYLSADGDNRDEIEVGQHCANFRP